MTEPAKNQKPYGTFLPRVHPSGGFYCEHGTMTANSCRNKATFRRAEVTLAQIARRPGSVVCEEHMPPQIGRALWVSL